MWIRKASRTKRDWSIVVRSTKYINISNGFVIFTAFATGRVILRSVVITTWTFGIAA